MATFICACFAKSSVMWIPMLYISTSTYFRLSFVDMNCMDKQGPMSSASTGTYNPYALPRKNEGAQTISVIQASKEKRCSTINKQ
ncbi:unnamed protein product [Rotaria magnacalcarata]|nr:unnamed protein product [Rotaria magnacalcarata]